MKLTSSEANKLLKKLAEKKRSIVDLEMKCSYFVASIDENVDEVRPKYNFEETQKEIKQLDDMIVRLKHAINLFNTKTTITVDGEKYTIDQVLVKLPQLNESLKRYYLMKNRLPKERVKNLVRSSSVIEYDYTNYDIEAAEKAFNKTNDLITKFQLALNEVNATKTLEVGEIDL